MKKAISFLRGFTMISGLAARTQPIGAQPDASTPLERIESWQGDQRFSSGGSAHDKISWTGGLDAAVEG